MLFRRGQVLSERSLNELAANAWKHFSKAVADGVRGIASAGGLFDADSPPVRMAVTVDSPDYPIESAVPAGSSGFTIGTTTTSNSSGTECLGNYPIKFVDLVELSSGETDTAVRDRQYICQNIYGDWIPPNTHIMVFEHRGRLLTDYQGQGGSSVGSCSI